MSVKELIRAVEESMKVLSDQDTGLATRTIRIQNSIDGHPFIVDACDTDGTDTKLSTKDWMLEEITNIGMLDLLYEKMEDGIYKVILSPQNIWDDAYDDFEINFIKVKLSE